MIPKFRTALNSRISGNRTSKPAANAGNHFPLTSARPSAPDPKTRPTEIRTTSEPRPSHVRTTSEPRPNHVQTTSKPHPKQWQKLREKWFLAEPAKRWVDTGLDLEGPSLRGASWIFETDSYNLLEFSDFPFPLQPPTPPPSQQTPRPSHPKKLDFGPFRLRFGPFRSVWVRLALFRVCFGSGSAPFRGVGWRRGGIGERGFCKGKEYHYLSSFE